MGGIIKGRIAAGWEQKGTKVCDASRSVTGRKGGLGSVIGGSGIQSLWLGAKL